MRAGWSASLLVCAIAGWPPLAAARAQDAADQTAGDDLQDGRQTIIVTGTRLRSDGTDRTSPTQVVQRDEFLITGVPNVEQTLNQLPQLVGGFTNTSNNPGTGAATLDLRGLGSVRTLVLVNGRRWIASDAGEVPEVDVNTIPAALIDRVDVVTGGASAVYGSDAVTGVINFVLRDDLEGLWLDARQNVTGRGDGRVTSADLSVGGGFGGGRGRMIASAGWLSQEDVLQGDRHLSRVTLNDGCTLPGTRDETGAGKPAADPECGPPNALGFTAGGSGFIPGSRILGRAFFPVSGSPQLVPNAQGVRFDPNGQPRPFNAATDLYNFAPDNYLQVPFRRWSGNLLASVELDPAVQPYTELTYVRTQSDQQLAAVPAALGGGTGTVPVARINLANPFLTAEAARLLDLSYGLDVAGNRGFTGTPATGFRINPAFAGDADGIIVLPIILQSRLDLGPRRSRNVREAYRGLIGLRGGLSDAWSYDAYVSRSRVEHVTALQNGGSARRLQQALLAVRDPVSGEPVCIDGSNGCRPANIFGAGNLSPEAAAFIRTDPSDVTIVEEEVAEVAARGEFALLPAGTAGLAVGATWRRSAYSFAPDPSLFTGDDLGFQPGTPAAGSTKVWELFAETRLPLLSEQPLAERLTLELGARWSRYQTTGTAWTWKALAEWAPAPPLAIRAGYQRAVRAPNVRELFEQPVSASGAALDPCSASYGLVVDPLIAAACIRNGVPESLIGTELFGSPVVTSRGNPDLSAEIARTFTIGAVLTLPRPDLSLAIDYYDISIDAPIGPFGGGDTQVLFGCITTGADPADPLCQAFSRGADGTLLSIDQPTVNLDRLVARGLDWQLVYRTELDGVGGGASGKVSVSLSGTRYFENALRTSATVEPVDCAGLFGGTCGNTITRTATPRWKLYNVVGWTFGGATLSLRHRWFSATTDSRNAQRAARGLPLTPLPEEGRILESRHYFDLAATLKLGEAYAFTVGVNNLSDKRPAITGSNQVQANTDPSLYDVLGRRFFVTLSARLP